MLHLIISSDTESRAIIMMYRLERVCLFWVRNLRRARKAPEKVEEERPEKLKFSEEELTEMGMYRTKPKARGVTDLFSDKATEQVQKDYIRKQKKDMKFPDIDFSEFEGLEEEQPVTPKMERTSKQTKRESHKTFKIYKHIDKVKKKAEQAEAKIQALTEDRALQTQDAHLNRLARVRLIEQYLPYDYMKQVQKIFHKYNQTGLRDVAFHFTNLMKLRYSEQKVDYEENPAIGFNKLQQKIPHHRKVEQIYLTSKEKIYQQEKERQEQKLDRDPIEPHIKYSQNMTVSYLLNRVPRTYAVAYRALNEIKKMYAGYSPQSFIDFGAGLSSGSAAFIEQFGDTGRVFSVEPAGKMRKLAKYLTEYSKMVHFESLAELSAQVKKAEIVYCGYVLNQLRPQLIPVYLQALYAKVENHGFLIFTQYGNPFGARLVHEARKWALTKQMRIVAPCPHHMRCPLATTKQHWCHFDQPSGMYPREVFGKLPFESNIKNQKYSYLILQKREDQQQVGPVDIKVPEANISQEWDRVVFPLMRKGQHFNFTLCTTNGTFQKRTSAKSHGMEYKWGHRLRWGDYWRFGKRIPNRYRKQRASGKRLW